MGEVRLILKDHQWDRIAPHLPGKRSDPGRTGADNRCKRQPALAFS
jgi:putative transposase